jgi:hypothetical protein
MPTLFTLWRATLGFLAEEAPARLAMSHAAGSCTGMGNVIGDMKAVCSAALFDTERSALDLGGRKAGGSRSGQVDLRKESEIGVGQVKMVCSGPMMAVFNFFLVSR